MTLRRRGLLALAAVALAAAAPQERSTYELSWPSEDVLDDQPAVLLQQQQPDSSSLDERRNSALVEHLPAEPGVPYMTVQLDADTGVGAIIEMANCQHEMGFGPVLVLLIVCAAVFLLEIACMWDGFPFASCFDRPLLARLLLSDNGKPTLSDTAPTAEPRQLTLLATCQLALIMLGSFTLDVLFTAVATFLPGRASLRGISGSSLGLVFATYPIGEAFAAVIAPKLLTYSWADPVVGARKALLGAALVVAAGGVVDVATTEASGFIIGVVVTRFLQGFASGVNEVMVTGAVYTLCGPTAAAFVVSAMMAVRLLACAVGPTIGGHLYELGCWAAPFFVCALVLLLDAILQLLLIGRRARGELAKTGKTATPSAILSRLTAPALMKVVFDVVGWVHMAGFEVTLQPFFGESPYRQTPGQIGNLLLCATLVNAVAYIAAPPFAVAVGASYVIPVAAPIGFAVGLLVGPSPWLPGIPTTMTIQALAWSASAFLFALNFPCGLILWPSIVSEMGFTTDEVAGVLGSIQVLTSAIGGVTGPIVFSAAGEASNYPLVYTIDAVVVLVAAEIYGLTLLYRFRREHPPRCCVPRAPREEETGKIEPSGYSYSS